MQARVDVALKQLSSKATPTIAFHARGGDKRDEDKQCAQAACHRCFSMSVPADSQARKWPSNKPCEVTLPLIASMFTGWAALPRAMERMLSWCSPWRLTVLEVLLCSSQMLARPSLPLTSGAQTASLDRCAATRAQGGCIQALFQAVHPVLCRLHRKIVGASESVESFIRAWPDVKVCSLPATVSVTAKKRVVVAPWAPWSTYGHVRC